MESHLISMSQADNGDSQQKVINWIPRHMIEIYLYKRVGLKYITKCFQNVSKIIDDIP